MGTHGYIVITEARKLKNVRFTRIFSDLFRLGGSINAMHLGNSDL